MHGLQIDIGGVQVRLLRLGLTGELGFELHVPVTGAATVLDLLLAAGKPFGIGFYGARALDSLRLEKGYCVWGLDLGSHVTPDSAGLGHLLSRGKAGFTGRDTAQNISPTTLARTLTTLSIDEPLALSGGEAFFSDGTLIGYASSAGYGHTVRKSILMGYVPCELPADASIEIEAEGRLFPATRHNRPLYDADGLRLRR